MKLKGYKNIISDSDINITGQYLQGTLDTILDKQEQDINELKRNVKFLYQYGGVGSHSGSGGSSSKFSIYATLNKVQITNGNLISLDGPGNYNLQIMVNRPGGLQYRITYTYWNSRSSQDGISHSETLNMSNSYILSTTLDLDINGQIRIDSVSELGERGDQITANYITSPYTFETYLGDSEGNRFNVRDNELFIDNVANSGLYAYISYDVGIQGSVSYSYNKLNPEKIVIFEQKQDIDLTESSRGIVQLPICPDEFLIDENSGYYTININISVTPLGQNEIIVNRIINLNLIPNSLYLKITPNNKDASLYDNNTVEEPYAFSIGSIVFDLKIYEGYVITGKTQYEITPSIKNVSNGIVNQFGKIYANERESVSTRNLSSSYSGWNIVTFDVLSTYSGNSITVQKYFYVKESSTLNWGYFIGKNSGNNLHYGINNGSFGTSEFSNAFNADRLLIQSESIPTKTINIVDDRMNNYSVGETLINISIQYSSINDINRPILEIKSNDNNNLNDIKLYQGKIEIGPSQTQSGTVIQKGVKIFLPKEDSIDPSNSSKYHLLTLYRKHYTDIDSEPRFEFLVYLDGVLEGALPNIEPVSTLFKQIVFYNTGFSINLFDIMYFPYSSSSETNNFFTDADISRYWYTYNYFYSTGKYSDEKLDFLLSINSVASKFKLNSKSVLDDTINTKMVGLNEEELLNLVKIPGLAPVLVFDVVDDVEFSQPNSDFSNNFLKWYQIPQLQGKDVTGEKKVSVSFKGENETKLTAISDSDEYTFFIKKQGTSTLRNFAKNLTLTIKSNIQNRQCLFSPNFEEVNLTDSEEEKIRKYNTFLPEQEFTLKKDVVDSAHANNNSIADFVNNKTTKFTTGEEGKYAPYIKNCLTGFPCLIFVRTHYYHEPTRTNYISTYYLGYYNFNLGRESHYNLGYNSTLNFNGIENLTDGETGLSNGFKVYSITTDINKLKDGIMVSEIQDNGSYYDFSQYDPTVLFGANSADDFSMLGDDKHSSSIEVYQDKVQKFVKSISLSGGYIFQYLQKNFGNQTDEYLKTIQLTKQDEETGNEITYTSSYNQVPDYRVQYEKVFSNNSYQFVPKDTPGELGTRGFLLQTLNGDQDQEIEIPPSLDYTSLIEYYVILMAFGMTDSIQKNLNIKSWNDGDTFSIAFYDMDTALGVDNGGNEVSYFAFSDYYDIPSDESYEGQASLLKKAIVYRDFAFQGTGSYDVPSSYLFAIAKYAKLILGDSLNADTFPLYYWTRLRSTDLLNADVFMNKYYKNRKSNVGESLINYNYRATYFVEDVSDNSITYVSNEFSQFNGSRENKVRDWLNDRLHILDVYMGLISISPTQRYIEYLNPNSLKWEVIIQDSELPLTELEVNNKPTDNDDIIVFKDIFSTSGANYFSQNISAQIRALENSFTVITVPNQNPEYYLIKDPTRLYRINIQVNGTQNISIGGSDRWIYVDNLAPFTRNNNQLYINSNNLQEFNISGMKTINNVSGNLPAVRKINIYGPNNLFTLQIGNNTMLPNVQSVILQNCKVSVNINNSSITSFRALGVQSDSLSIQNCSYLSEIQIGNLVENSSTIVTTLNSLTIGPLNDSFISTGIKIKEINISAIGENRILKIQDNVTLEKLTISGFTSIELKNCPNLYEIKINGNLTVSDFKIINCGNGSGVSPLKINYIDGGNYNVNLSGFTITGEISFSGTQNLYSIDLPSCKLSSRAFYNTNLTTLHAQSNKSVIILGSETFYSCPLNSGLNYLLVDSNCTSLASTFSSGGTSDGKLPLNEIKTFLNNIPDDNSITNINYLFGWQKTFIYNITNNFSSEKTEANCSLSLRKFKKVTSAVGVFVGTNLEYLNKFIFSGLGDNNSNNGKVNLSDSLNVSSSNLYCTIDSLYYIIGKTDRLNIFTGIHNDSLSNIGVSSRKLILVNKTNGNTYNDSQAKDINIIEFFRKSSSDIIDFQDVYNVQFSQEFNYYQFFAYPDENNVGNFIINWPNLQIIYNCFDKVYSKYEGSQQSFETLNLNQLPQLKYIYNSFNEINSPEYIDLNNLINWNVFIQANSSNVSFSILNLGDTRKSNISGRLLFDSFKNIKKHVNKQDFDLINNKLKTCSYYKKFGNIFENVLLISDDENGFTPYNNDDTWSNTFCNQMYNTFSKVKIISTNYIPNEQYNDIWYNSLVDEAFIPIDINNIISKYPNCTVFNGTFSEITINKALQIDFFKRRKAKTTDIYLIDQQTNELLINDDSYVRGKLVQYTYNQNQDNLISNLTRCFYKTKIDKDSKQYFNKDNFSDFNQIPVNHIEDLQGNILSDTKYKTGIQSSALTVQQNNEILDCSNIKVRYDKDVYSGFDEISSYQNISLKDFDNDNSDYDNTLFVAPDIFYGCSGNCNITECFAECNFTGALPEHLFSPFNNNSPTITNWINKTNILPRFLLESEMQYNLLTQLNQPLTKRNYIFVPSNFGNITNYNQGFTFNLRIPPVFDIGDQSNPKVIAYYIFANDSISNKTSTIENALPVYIEPFITGSVEVGGQVLQAKKQDFVNPGNIYINIMFNKTNNSDGFSLVNVITSNLFTGPYTKIGYGRLFYGTASWTNYKNTSGKTVITFSEGTTTNKVLKHIFPITGNNIANYITNNGATIGSSGYVTKVYKNLILGGDTYYKQINILTIS